MDTRAEKILQEIREACEKILGENLLGIYVHGSLALGCFLWERSDIDFLIVTKDVPTDAVKVALLRALLTIDEHAPQKGLEMSLVTEDACCNFRYPTPFELHYSRTHRDKAERVPENYVSWMHGTDPDLAAHFRVTKYCGIALCGPEIDELFAPVPSGDYMDSIRRDVVDAEEDILRDPIYITLNLCRVWSYMVMGVITSKEEGGRIGQIMLEGQERALVKKAHDCYEKGEPWLPNEREKEALVAFARNMMPRIFPPPKKTRILRNAIRCNRCGDVIESTHRHDYVRCSCGACAVDGGLDYLRRTFDSKDCYTELSETVEE